MRGSWLGLLVTAALLPSLATAAPAQIAATEAASSDAVGDWFGALTAPGVDVRLGLHFRRDQGKLAGTIDVPQYGAAGAPLARVDGGDGTLAFELSQGQGQYSGRWDSARSAYVGEFTAPAGKLPLVLARGTLPPPPPVDWKAPPVSGLDYRPGPAARPTTGIALPVGKCMNMANQLEATPAEGSWGPKIAEDDFRILKQAGFTTVRIPVRWSAHAGATAPYAIDPAFLKRVHHVVELASAAGLNVMLNVHHYEELMKDPEAHSARFAALWGQIAASFASAPASVWFELLNEPTDKLTDANLAAVLGPALAAVRESNRTRPVVIGGQNWSGLASLATLKLPDDPYVVPTFHYYDPFLFTHQGATWMAGGGPPFGRPYGSAEDKALLDRDIATAKAYMAQTGRVPILGEYGATDDHRLPIEQRLRYYRAISSGFASIGVQSCAWGYRSGFKLRDGDKWIPGAVEAMATVSN